MSTVKLPPGFQLVEDGQDVKVQLPEGFQLVQEDAPAKGTTIGGLAKAAGTGLAEGVIGVVGLPGTLADAFDSGADWLFRKGAKLVTGQEPTPLSQRPGYSANPLSFSAIKQGIESVTGEFYKPQTVPEEYARTLGEFAPNALSPGSAVAKVGQALVPAFLSETAGQATKGTAAEPYARVAAAIAGSGGVAALDNAMRPSAVPGLSRKAADYAMDTVANPQRRAAMEGELQRLGPEATLADVSPEWLGVARGAASRPGQRDAIVNALVERHEGANARLGADLNRTLGPAPIPSHVERDIQAGRDALGPEYDRVFAGSGVRAVDPTPLANDLDAAAIRLRGPAQGAVRDVRRMLDVPGNPGVLDPDPSVMHQVRQAIDGMIEDTANSQVARRLGDARQRVDAELAQAVPGIKDVDAQYAELSRQGRALDRGQTLLDTGRETVVRPVELADEIAQGALPQGTMVGPSAVPLRLRQGTRAEIDRVVGTNANDPAALQRLVKGEGDWNRDKLRMLFGQDRADAALNAIDRETTFARTGHRVTAGSDTAMANRFGNFLDETATPTKIPENLTVLGALGKALNVGREARAAAKAERFAGELGQLSVARGADRDAFIQSITQALAERGVPPGRAGVIASLMASRAASNTP